MKGTVIRLLYLRTWRKLHHLVTRPRSTWSFLLGNETANFTYGLANEHDLPNFVALATGIPVADLDEYLGELAVDTELHGWLRTKMHRHDRTDRALVGRRAGWYLLVRGIKPCVVLETGTDAGVGSAVLARALQRNSDDGGPAGHLWTFDLSPDAGWATPESLRTWVTLVPGDLHETLPQTVEDLPAPIDLMIHDSDHSYEHEMFEFRTAGPYLAEDGVLLTDNGHATTVLHDYSQETRRRYSFWREQPEDHPYPGAGIGLSVGELLRT